MSEKFLEKMNKYGYVPVSQMGAWDKAMISDYPKYEWCVVKAANGRLCKAYARG